MAIIVYNTPVEIPGLVSTNYRGTPSWLGVPGPAGRRRHSSETIKHVVLHTTKGCPRGAVPQLVHPGVGPVGQGAEANATYWARKKSRGYAGAQLIVDSDGTVVCAADVGSHASYHAGYINGVSVGIELVQRNDGELWECQFDTAEKLCWWLCQRFGLDVSIKGRFTGVLPRKDGAHPSTLATVVGHCDLTRNKGVNDPGQPVRDWFAKSNRWAII